MAATLETFKSWTLNPANRHIKPLKKTTSYVKNKNSKSLPCSKGYSGPEASIRSRRCRLAEGHTVGKAGVLHPAWTAHWHELHRQKGFCIPEDFYSSQTIFHAVIILIFHKFTSIWKCQKLCSPEIPFWICETESQKSDLVIAYTCLMNRAWPSAAQVNPLSAEHGGPERSQHLLIPFSWNFLKSRSKWQRLQPGSVWS